MFAHTTSSESLIPQGVPQRLTFLASSMSRKPRSERSRRSKSTMRRLVELQAILCYYVCFSCTRPLMPRSASSPSRPSGTRIIFLFPSFSHSIPTPPDASSATRLTHFPPLTMTTSGPTAWDMKAGAGSCGEVDCISLNVSIGRSEHDEILRSLELYAIHMVRGSHQASQT